MPDRSCETCHFYVRSRAMCRWARGPFDDGSGGDQPARWMRQPGGQCGPDARAFEPRTMWSLADDFYSRLLSWSDQENAKRRRLFHEIEQHNRVIQGHLDSLAVPAKSLIDETRKLRDEIKRREGVSDEPT